MDDCVIADIDIFVSVKLIYGIQKSDNYVKDCTFVASLCSSFLSTLVCVRIQITNVSLS